MTRFNAVLLAIAALALVGFSSVAAIQCSQSMVGKTYKADTPLYYMTCKDANTPMELTCLTGSGYINNGTLSGCVPWQLWTYTSKAAPPTCTAASVGSVFPTVNPQNYYNCTAVGVATLQSCPVGTAFNPDPTNNVAAAGCIAWATWWTVCPY